MQVIFSYSTPKEADKLLVLLPEHEDLRIVEEKGRRSLRFFEILD